MRNVFSILPFILIASLLSSCSNNNSEPKTNQPDKITVKNNIRNLIDQTWSALSEQNLEKFNKYVLSDWQLYTARGNKMSAKSLINLHKKNLTNFNLDYSDLKIHVQDSIAWATYDATMSGQWQGEDWGGQFIFTNVFVRDKEQWKVAHMHESEKPETG
jgi:hypothetical protein